MPRRQIRRHKAFTPVVQILSKPEEPLRQSASLRDTGARNELRIDRAVVRTKSSNHNFRTKQKHTNIINIYCRIV